jgi:hypothetical protein
MARDDVRWSWGEEDVVCDDVARCHDGMMEWNATMDVVVETSRNRILRNEADVDDVERDDDVGRCMMI